MKTIRFLLLTALLIAGLPVKALNWTNICQFASQNKVFTAGFMLLATYCAINWFKSSDTQATSSDTQAINLTPEEEADANFRAMANIFNINIEVYSYPYKDILKTYSPRSYTATNTIKLLKNCWTDDRRYTYTHFIKQNGHSEKIKLKDSQNIIHMQYFCVMTALKNISHTVEADLMEPANVYKLIYAIVLELDGEIT